MQNDDLMIDDGTHFDDDKLLLLVIMMMSYRRYFSHGKSYLVSKIVMMNHFL